MLWLIYTSAVILFSFSFFILKILPAFKNIFEVIFNVLEVISNHLLEDKEKQKIMQKLSLVMLRHFLVLSIRVLLVAISVLFPFYIADYLALVSIENSSNFVMRLDVILITTFIAVAGYYLWKKWVYKEFPETYSSFNEMNYSTAERAIHNIYFGSASLQRILNATETKFFSKQWEGVNTEKPVFITSLARSGTTVLLESLTSLPSLSSHTYRDMPFVLSPILGAKILRIFKRKTFKRERAHGDGVLIDSDSPEALEEAIWLKFFPQKYSESKIHLWSKADASFLEIFSESMKRIIYLRSSGDLPNDLEQGRYLSKNNANISRIPVLKEMFPNGFIIVPIRDPFEQAISMLRQHKNFQAKQSRENFTKKYMADIGHFEFGELHRLIDFPEVDEFTKGFNPEQIEYWLGYWLAAYSYLETVKGLIYISYKSLCEDSENCLSKLCSAIEMEASKEQLNKAVQGLKGPPIRKQEYHFPLAMSEQAEELYKRLISKTL